MKEEYDDDVEEEDRNEDDRMSLNDHKRYRPCGGRNKTDLVQNL